jgi:hypothetical protein
MRCREPLTVAMTLIETRPHHWRWKVFEGLGAEPVFPQKIHAIDYAQSRANLRAGKLSSPVAKQPAPFDPPAGLDAKRGPRAEGWRFALDPAQGHY